jgi:xanthine dehydrogenase accessory factor
LAVGRIYEQLAELAAAQPPFALALIAGTKGSSPQHAGAKAIFFPDGNIVGTLGGGCLEAEVQSRALKALKTGEPAGFRMLLDHDFGWDDGLICGGRVEGIILPQAADAVEVWRKLATATESIRWGVKNDFSVALAGQPSSGSDALGDDLRCTENAEARVPGPCTPTRSAADWLYQETVSPPIGLWIAGSGHVAQAIAPLAQQLDFAVTVFDDRPGLANHRCFAPETKLRVGPWHELLQTPPPVSPAFGLVVTRGHQHDALVLSEWVRFPFAFLGMIGSRRKARIMREQFIKQNLASAEQFDRIACPVGLDIAAVGPPEIAVSVVAQLIQRRAALRE